MQPCKLLSLILCVLWLVVTSACVQTGGPTATVTSGQDSPTINEVQMEAYNGPKARVAVAKFTNKSSRDSGMSGWFSPAIGTGMADQLTTALFNTNRFIVLERESLNSVLTEQNLGASGRIKQGTEAAIGEIEGVELLIVGAITEFSGNKTGGSGSGLLDAVGLGVVSDVAGDFKKAHIAIDVRVIDAQTSRILGATSVEGEATDVNLGGGLSGSTFSAGLSGWKNTPMEKAVRICINKAAQFIASKTPQQYYRHGQGAASVTNTTTQETVSKQTQDFSKATIREVQDKLNALGYDVGVADGIMGSNTSRGIRDFQWQYKLNETGKIDQETLNKIREVTNQ